MSTKEKTIESPFGMKSLKVKASTQFEKEASVNVSFKESKETNKEWEDDKENDAKDEPEPIEIGKPIKTKKGKKSSSLGAKKTKVTVKSIVEKNVNKLNTKET